MPMDMMRQGWEAFIRREPLLVAAPTLIETINEIFGFALPPVKAAATGAEFDFRWIDGGPWAP